MSGSRRPPAVFLADFGLAKDVRTGSRFTRTGATLGTPAYMSPELARGEVAALTPASDVWALGCVLHELVQGRPPFAGDTGAAIVAAVITGRRSPMEGVPAGVRQLTDGCLARRAGERAPGAAWLRADAVAVLAGRPPRFRPRRWRRRALATLAVGLAAGTSWGVAAWTSGRGAGALPAAPGPGDARVQRVEELVARAWTVWRDDPREAGRLLDEALAQAPDRHDLRVRRGLIAWAIDEGAQARALWNAVPAASAAWAASRFHLGLEAFARSDTAAAAEALVPIQQDPALGHVARAALACIAQAWGQARTLLAEDERWEALWLLAYLEGADPAGDPRRAVQLFTRTFAAAPPLPDALAQRGILQMRMGDFDSALADFDAALRIRPEWPRALFNRGDAWRAHADALAAQGDLDGADRALATAVRDLDGAIERQPDYRQALDARGWVWNRIAEFRVWRGDEEGARMAARTARTRFDDVLARYAPTPVSLHGRAMAREKLGDVEGALSDLDAAAALESMHADVLADRAMLRAQRGRNAEALEDLDRAVAHDPENAGWRSNRALVLEALGRLGDAMADYDAALVINPKHFLANYNRGRLLVMQGLHARALKNLDRALALRGDFIQGLCTRAQAYLGLARWDDARSDLRRARALATPGFEAIAWINETLRTLGDR